MGTKRPSGTLFDTLSNINTSDRKLQPGGKISRDPSPRPAMTAQSERVRDREEDWRRERETEKMRDKPRYKDSDPRERLYERDRGPVPRPRQREGEREWRERERRHEDDRRGHGRPLSNLEKETDRLVERGMKKGDTFPRMRKGSPEGGSRMTPTTAMRERGDRRQRERPKRIEADEWDRERERERQRERHRERERDEMRSRVKEGGRRPVEEEKSRPRERYHESDPDRKREVGDTLDRRERDAGRKREKPGSNMRERDTRMPSPSRRRDGEIYLDRKDKENPHKEGRRDTRSEGDSDERERRREGARDKEREELIYQQSKSEGDNKSRTERGDREEDKHRDRDRDGEVDQSRRRRAEKERERYRETDRERERWKDDRYRENDQRRRRETKEREADPRRDKTTDRRSQAQNETAPRAPPRAQSSGELSSDMDSELRHRRGRDSYEERESERGAEEQRNSERNRKRSEQGETTEQRRMWLEPQRGKNSKGEFVDRERHSREQERRMASKTEWEKDGRRVKEEPDERNLDQSGNRERHGGRDEYSRDRERESVGVSVDGEEVGQVWRELDKGGKEHLSDSDGGIERNRQRNAEEENVTDNTEESDREEEGGSDYWARSGSEEGGSETGCKQDRDRMLSGEDGFVTVSSGGDEEDDREEEEEEFEDCQEFLEGEGSHDGHSPVAFREEKEREEEKEDEEGEGREKQQNYVFCVTGQTSSTSHVDPRKGVEKDDPSLDSSHHCGDDATQPQSDLRKNDNNPVINNQDAETSEVDVRYRESSEPESAETGEGTKRRVEHPYAEIDAVKRDSQTERLLIEWREKSKDPERRSENNSPVPTNPYADVFSQVDFEKIQPILDGIKAGAMSPEEVEAIRIRMSGAWSMSEEPKRHSQAPHLKWAKNVVREILGRSEEQTLEEPNKAVQEAEAKEGTGEMTVVRSDQEHSEPELEEEEGEEEEEEEEPLEVEGLRGMGQNQADMHADQFSAMHADISTHTHADTLLYLDRKEDHDTDVQTEEKADVEVKISKEVADEGEISEREEQARREKEVEMYLSVSNTLYKPNSCPILNYDSESDHLSSREDEGQEVEEGMGGSEEEKQGGESEERGTADEVGQIREGEVGTDVKINGGTLTSSCSFRDLGPEARFRRRGIRKTTERRKGELVEVEEEEEGVGRDRRPRIFSTTDDEDDRSKSWGEIELRNVLETIDRRKRNSRFFNAQLYQQYSEDAQNSEILRQAHSSDVLSVGEDPSRSPVPSPPPARRPLPPLPSVPHPHSFSHTGSITSIQSLPLPKQRRESRPTSPRLSISLTQSSSLWRELPGVRNSVELEELNEDERRLQEVRFEVVTSEASYCRSLDIVVEHFVKCKQLGALLTTQDRNWLFSRLADVRAISHSFLSKLEERVESNIIHFTVCDIIARHCQRFKMVYVPYLTNQSYQDATYQRLMNENQGFRRIVEKLERSPVCQRLPLRSFLVLPFQRITRIKLLVQNIVKRTTPGTPEATHAIKSLKLLEKLIQESNDSITQMKSIESLVCLSAKVDFECRTLPLISQSRRLVREGLVTELMDFSLKDTERNIYMHLFTDYLLVSLQKEGGRFTVIDHAPVAEVRAENCRVKLHSLQKNLIRLHMSSKALLLRTDTQSDKLRWISALSRPHPDVDFSAAQDFPQMQCIRAFVGQQPDELSLEKADIILVHQQSSDHWVEGTRLPDRHRGWVPESHLETISNSRVQQRNLLDALKLTTAKAAI
ncbi:trichohyalin isoform X1 [Notolabrus celidotus]|uniref:trichohyalin isoform X1 n=1 Tax=Notolabrus celidotus TaxID=1203425 RepID=UPI00148FB207|nr:trichohyalin isoform X1 [Notolabrus celidotus]XP_034553084.1 trichohyalin isoform X1 [Notolabrus celidotus]XP_034553085.1 trichohyalin isoform X1 [Notolabrus celidotus]